MPSTVYAKKGMRLAVVFIFVAQAVLPAAWAQTTVSPYIAEFLCEQGVRYYDQHKFAEALQEFKKALLANPESLEASRYIALIEARDSESSPIDPDREQAFLVDAQREVAPEMPKILGARLEKPPRSSKIRRSVIDDLDRAVLVEKKVLRSSALPSSASAITPKGASLPALALPADQTPLEEHLDIRQPDMPREMADVETNMGVRLILVGDRITRFLVTDPVFLAVTKLSDQELLVEPREIGSTSLYVWDSGQRRSFKITIGPQRWEQAAGIQELQSLKEKELPDSFKVSYSLDDSSFYTGRRVGAVERQGHTIAYTSSVKGETPYGKFDAATRGSRTSAKTYRISNIRMGLMDAHYDQFKDIDIRWFDFTPAFSSFGFPATDLRGVNIQAPMFSHALNYNAFWGAIPESGFSFASSREGLTRTKKAWLEGVGLHYRLGRIANFRTFWAHSYGSDRTQPVLTSDTGGLGMDYHLGPVDVSGSMASDTKHISYTGRTSVSFSKVHVGLAMTDTHKRFASILGGRPSSGSTSGSLTTVYRPTPEVTISNSFSGNRDKVFGNPDDPTRPNYTGATRVSWIADTHTEYEAGYTMDDQLGSNTPAVTETKELTMRKRLFFIRKLGTYLTYQNSKSKNYTAPALDYNNNRILMGLSFRVISELYFYYNKEINLLRNRYSGQTATPLSQEFGLTIYRQIYDSPFYGRFRLYYRDEEQTESSLSYLGGEDRLEGEGELIYKANADTEAFVRLRVANIWAEKTGVAKHVDLDLNWGLRLLWDTGLRWVSSGHFSGHVFYDANADGVRQGSEKGVKGVIVKGPSGKTATTDASGYYKISGIRGRRATIEVDTSSLPRGYNLTTPGQKDSEIVHASTKKIDFGIATRSEISGLVFWDKNGNGTYEAEDEPVKGVVLSLDGKDKIASSMLGEFRFRKMSMGDHELRVDLKTVPVQYIPKVPIKQKVSVQEGQTIVVNIPLELQIKK